LLPRLWELRTSVTAYDAVYLALAEILEAPLLALDRRLARARGHGARIEVP
jgi:predicted nucleic acid-binding protein